jgi:hypothetical protein
VRIIWSRWIANALSDVDQIAKGIQRQEDVNAMQVINGSAQGRAVRKNVKIIKSEIGMGYAFAQVDMCSVIRQKNVKEKEKKSKQQLSQH